MHYIMDINTHLLQSEGISLPIEGYQTLRVGEDFIFEDKLISAHKYTFENIAKSYCYISDTLFIEEYTNIIKDINILYHEATYMDDLLDKAIATFHSTTKQAGLFAQLIKADKLIIGHFSARYGDLVPLEKETQSIFKNTIAAYEGLKVTI